MFRILQPRRRMLPISRGYFLPSHSRHPTKWCIRLLGSSHTTLPVGDRAVREPMAWLGLRHFSPMQGGAECGEHSVTLWLWPPSWVPHFPKLTLLAPPPTTLVCHHIASSWILQSWLCLASRPLCMLFPPMAGLTPPQGSPPDSLPISVSPYQAPFFMVAILRCH